MELVAGDLTIHTAPYLRVGDRVSTLEAKVASLQEQVQELQDFQGKVIEALKEVKQVVDVEESVAAAKQGLLLLVFVAFVWMLWNGK